MGDDVRDRVGKAVRFGLRLFGGEPIENVFGSAEDAFTAEEADQQTGVVDSVERAHRLSICRRTAGIKPACLFGARNDAAK